MAFFEPWLLVADVRHEDELEAAATSNRTELSRLTKELEVTRKMLSQQKMTAESLNSQVATIHHCHRRRNRGGVTPPNFQLTGALLL